jgi:glycosyltransferase involved in cell wall biosynthesis
VPPIMYGGIERIVSGLAGGLRALGHKVGLVATPGSSCVVDQFYGWRGKTPLGKRDTLVNTALLLRAFFNFRPDVVHSFSRAALLTPILRSRKAKIISLQLPPQVRNVGRVQRLGRNVRFTGCSEHICRAGQRGGGRWTAIHNFVELDKFTFTPTVASDAPLVFLSRIEEQKGAHLAIEIAKRTGRPLIIAGNHSPTADAAVFWRQRIEPEIGRNGISYIGPVNDQQKDALLGRASAMVVPVQWDEPFGIVFAESLACGTPVLSCPRGAVPEIVRNGLEGFLASAVEDLCHAVGQIPKIRRQACRERAENCFSVAVIARKYEHLYESMLIASR